MFFGGPLVAMWANGGLCICGKLDRNGTWLKMCGAGIHLAIVSFLYTSVDRVDRVGSRAIGNFIYTNGASA